MPAPRNRLLAALPPADRARLWPSLEPVELALREIIFPPGEPLTSVLFPERGWTSNLVTLENGNPAEVGLIGREGMVGLPLLYGDDRSLTENIVQSPGTALRLGANAFRAALEEIPALRRLLLRYALALQRQVAQTAACNVRHPTRQRLARWLLMAHERSDGDTLTITHEFLSQMLGIRRASVTVAVRALRRAGLIRSERGTIQVADRPGLEAAACECHGVVRREFDRLLGPAAHP